MLAVVVRKDVSQFMKKVTMIDALQSRQAFDEPWPSCLRDISIATDTKTKENLSGAGDWSMACMRSSTSHDSDDDKSSGSMDGEDESDSDEQTEDGAVRPAQQLCSLRCHQVTVFDLVPESRIYRHG